MGNLYDTILTLCESRGIKGGKMCSDIGISKGLLTDLKMGRRTGVSAVTAQKIATYFDVSVGYLLGEEEMGIKKEQPTVKYDGLSEELVELIGVLKELPKDKILALLQLAKSMK
jgi:transcriptional regulator with XRE-family HTH domain